MLIGISSVISCADPVEPSLQAFPHFIKEIVELPDVSLLTGNQKNELLGVRFLEELDCAG